MTLTCVRLTYMCNILIMVTYQVLLSCTICVIMVMYWVLPSCTLCVIMVMYQLHFFGAIFLYMLLYILLSCLLHLLF